ALDAAARAFSPVTRGLEAARALAAARRRRGVGSGRHAEEARAGGRLGADHDLVPFGRETLDEDGDGLVFCEIGGGVPFVGAGHAGVERLRAAVRQEVRGEPVFRPRARDTANLEVVPSLLRCRERDGVFRATVEPAVTLDEIA